MLPQFLACDSLSLVFKKDQETLKPNSGNGELAVA